MKNNDTNLTQEQRLTQYRADMQKAFQANDVDGFNNALDGMLQLKAEALNSAYEQKIQQLTEDYNRAVLTTRGVNQLTSEEKDYYQKFMTAAGSADPKQAVTGLADVMPKTIINRVFEDLKTNHPLLSKLNFIATAGLVEIVVNTNGYQEAAWGALTDEIVKELTAGFKVVKATLLKITAFLPIAKAMLELGPEWLDRFVRETLFEALANGLEAGYIAGNGKNKPIGMICQIGEGVGVVDGVYPEKEAVPIEDLSTVTVGGLLAQVSKSPEGKTRRVEDVLFLVNPTDYYQKVMPATTLMAPDGSYRNDVMPYPMDIIQSPSVPEGKALLGLGKRYIALLGSAKEGKIEYSDHARFLEDQRVYLIKAYANGQPADNNSFLLLDISQLQALLYTVVPVDVAAQTTAVSEDEPGTDV
ncbi:MAG: phage major capsid protein [Oscillospiraceae bacterium]|nr:phage major capsid protein [Oscillospiraceae bacterium]